MSKILVTGATGQLGRAVIEALLKRAPNGNISALVRDIKKTGALESSNVTIKIGDYKDAESLIRAFEGIDKLYFVSSSELQNRFNQHENVVAAAKAAGVQHIIYTSGRRETEDGSSPIAGIADAHWQTDQLIKSSGLNFTIMKHNLYTDIVPMFIGEDVLSTGTIYLPAGHGRAAYASRTDLAEAGAVVLTTDGHLNRVYELAGQTSVSFGEIATILSNIAGKTIQYVSPETEAFIEQLKTYNVPDIHIQGLTSFCQAIGVGEFDLPANDLKILLGRAPESVAAYLQKIYAKR